MTKYGCTYLNKLVLFRLLENDILQENIFQSHRSTLTLLLTAAEEISSKKSPVFSFLFSQLFS